ncbi:hypothetical protein ECANGB1_1907 [Enterospora canceri]|uniref:Uncharacterized protein n=1 Tax=Enterospora canceri TaxID=1081671 RepID=A0A1Y1S8X5_9MICR|nr:hypothetical protein ECANGB1_1907 [Enterospora canceri]
MQSTIDDLKEYFESKPEEGEQLLQSVITLTNLRMVKLPEAEKKLTDALLDKINAEIEVGDQKEEMKDKAKKLKERKETLMKQIDGINKFNVIIRRLANEETTDVEIKENLTYIISIDQYKNMTIEGVRNMDGVFKMYCDSNCEVALDLRQKLDAIEKEIKEFSVYGKLIQLCEKEEIYAKEKVIYDEIRQEILKKEEEMLSIPGVRDIYTKFDVND